MPPRRFLCRYRLIPAEDRDFVREIGTAAAMPAGRAVQSPAFHRTLFPMPFSEIPSSPSVAIVGATGAVGREMLAVLEQRRFPHGELRLLASARSAGTSVSYRDQSLQVAELTDRSFQGIDIA